ncbi:hypothetical protein GCM10023152_17370 [Agromyces bauzanensis]|uniref:Uncharacterized protein n=1 Tax=Agromyces bauzanensis TaxID=1308924 RepID=A0A917PTC0_9MICO|nr:hypothetical protein GCM10011372_31810 [Agromyces bauzanensis]
MSQCRDAAIFTPHLDFDEDDLPPPGNDACYCFDAIADHWPQVAHPEINRHLMRRPIFGDGSCSRCSIDQGADHTTIDGGGAPSSTMMGLNIDRERSAPVGDIGNRNSHP